MNKIKLLLFVVLATLFCVSIGFAAEKSFKADLTGNEEVPSVNTPAEGEAKFTLSDDGKKLNFTLDVRNIENPIAAHIHMGAAGKNGAPSAILFSGPKREGKFRGNLAQGSITEKELTGGLKGKSINALLALIKSGDVYVNVHTDGNPNGEIRGQIK